MTDQQHSEPMNEPGNQGESGGRIADQGSEPVGQPVADVPAKRRRWPLSSLLLFALSAALGLLAVLLWTGTIRPPAELPPVTPGAIRSVDVVSVLKSAGLDPALDPKLFVPRKELPVPGQGMTVNGAPMLIFVFPDRTAAEAAVSEARKEDILPASLPGDIAVNPGDVTVAQGSNIIVALVGGDDRTREAVRTAIEALP